MSSSEDDIPLANLKRKTPAASKNAASKKRKVSSSKSSKKAKKTIAKQKASSKNKKPTPKTKKSAAKGNASGAKAKAPGKAQSTKESKKFDIPGQTKERPQDTDPAYPSFEALRIFHTTNFRENGQSEMSAKWCLERGLLTKVAAKRWCKVFGK